MVLEIHFLNVGHGDCTFVKFPSGRLAMIDVNNSRSLPPADVEALAEARGLSEYSFKTQTFVEAGYRSWESYYESLLVDPHDYYVKHFAGSSVFRYVQTHPDMDHMTGLHRFFFDEMVSLENFWDTRNAKVLSAADFTYSKYDYRDWEAYTKLRAGTSGDGTTHTVLNKLQGAAGTYWSDDGVQVWGPSDSLVEVCDKLAHWNNSSYVLKIEFGGRSVVLAGDAEGLEWDEVCDLVGESEMSCDILKAAHHGRESGYWERAVDAMDPSIVICSVGKKPSTDASDEYASHGASVLSTRYHGTIKVQMWEDGEVWVDNAAGARIASLPIL